MSIRRVGLVAPGEMGSAVAAAITAAAVRVVWASHGRGDASRRRAEDAAIDDVGDLGALVAASDMLLSVCPPHAAVEVAGEVAAHGFTGLYLDANAVAPQTARGIAATVTSGGADYVDGGIIGGPPRERGTTRLYLAGARAAEVAALFDAGPLEAPVVGGAAPAASALKMAYAGWTKGSAALLLAVRAMASAEGVEAELLAEWKRSQPALAGRSERAAASAARKGWRWVGEMDEIAVGLGAAGLPDGFHVAAAAVFERVAHLRDTPTTDVAAVTTALLETGEER
ncbi:DUF1932 domain-containing protein [Egicoccus sp. AB-alg6-2]|uniref:DUF1932 domain-containing protein n=1 Tax=Egicoccus sp. AB-alg6-2 TaxID=3242692 RepID=UPI00359DD16B